LLPLPKNLERIINVIIPKEVIGHKDEYVEVALEPREVPIYDPSSCHVRVDVRLKFIPKNKVKKEEYPFISLPKPKATPTTKCRNIAVQKM